MKPTDPSLDQVESLLRRLWAALTAERTAVAHLDGAALGRAREEKEQLAGTLTAFDPQHLGRHTDVRRVQEIRALAQRVVQQARANALLLSDASDLIAARLGVRREGPTYDRRARFRSAQPQALTGKAV